MKTVHESLSMLEDKLKEGQTDECLQLFEEIKAMAVTEEENAAIDEFVKRNLDQIEEDINTMEQIAVRIQLEEVLEVVNLTYIARKYFGKSRSWLSQRVNGCSVNGKKATFTQEEIGTLNQALADISKIIGSHSVYC